MKLTLPKKILNAVILVSLSLFVALGAQAREPVSKSKFRGTAIGGHDTVAYHSLARSPHAKAAKGNKTYTVKWKGAKWRFGSRESAELFQASPEKFSPAYNGFCANALSLGKGLLKTDGSHWEIFGNQLYLFYAAVGRDRWLATDDISEFKSRADSEWERILGN